MLAAAGAHGLGFTLPVTLAIAGLLAVLVASYRQVIAASPTVAGRTPSPGPTWAPVRAWWRRPRWSWTTCSMWRWPFTAEVAALTSAFPNYRRPAVAVPGRPGGDHGGGSCGGWWIGAGLRACRPRSSVGSILVLIVVGLFRSAPVSTAAAAGHGSVLADNATTVGALLLLKAFASGCSALTGVEALANAVPSLHRPGEAGPAGGGGPRGCPRGDADRPVGPHLALPQPVEGVTVLAQARGRLARPQLGLLPSSSSPR